MVYSEYRLQACLNVMAALMDYSINRTVNCWKYGWLHDNQTNWGREIFYFKWSGSVGKAI